MCPDHQICEKGVLSSVKSYPYTTAKSFVDLIAPKIRLYQVDNELMHTFTAMMYDGSDFVWSISVNFHQVIHTVQEESKCFYRLA